MTTLHDHHPVGVAMAPAFVPATIAMFSEFGTRAEEMMVAMFDHHGFSACNRGRRNRDRAERGANVSELLHVFSSIE
jgi:hypothetical protein